MKKVVLVCCAILVLVGVGIGIWFAAMPYPISMWFEYHSKEHYCDTMPISRADFEEMMDAAGEILSWRELIVSVEDVEEDRATVCTVKSAGGTSDVSKRILMRKVRGVWRVEHTEVTLHMRHAISRVIPGAYSRGTTPFFT
jgi:hypothetical protein